MHQTLAPTRPNARQSAPWRISGMNLSPPCRLTDHAADSMLFLSKGRLFGLLPTKFPEYPMNTNTTLSKGSLIYLNQSLAARAGNLLLLLLLILPHLVQAQFNYVITNGTITITKYTGPVTAVTIPDTINGLPVTSIDKAFYNGATDRKSVV